MRLIGLLNESNPSQDVVSHHRELCEREIGFELLTRKVFEIKTVLLFADNLSVLRGLI